MIDNYLKPVRHLWGEKKNQLLIALGITVVVWILLFLGLLPTYSVTPLEHKLSYLFPIWMVVGVFAYAYLHYRVENLESEDKPKLE